MKEEISFREEQTYGGEEQRGRHYYTITLLQWLHSHCLKSWKVLWRPSVEKKGLHGITARKDVRQKLVGGNRHLCFSGR